MKEIKDDTLFDKNGDTKVHEFGYRYKDSGNNVFTFTDYHNIKQFYNQKMQELVEELAFTEIGDEVFKNERIIMIAKKHGTKINLK